MNCIVTGASGFIGSHLVERLLSDGHSVTALDFVVSEFIKAFRKEKRLKVHVLDLGDEKAVNPEYFKNIDWVFHLAGYSDIVPSILRPAQYHRANVTVTVNVLEACRKAKIKKFIYVASSTCYGKNPPVPTPETVPIAPQFPYALTKFLGELYALHYFQVYKVPVVSLRLFNVYGPRSRVSGDYGPVFSTFMAQKLAGKPFTVVGDGTQKRDFTYVSDVVSAMIAAAQSEVVGEVFNVGTGNPQSVIKLVELLGGSKIVHIPKRPGEPDSTHADISKITKMLGWQPKISFEEGVGEVLSHINDWKHAPVFTPSTIKKATKDWFRYLG
ncbi:NAD-dependent epimerase/dehydratase family protein [Candidatus Gottesmanbacteria bacterium]|nr:NAD-dependent epimerase/dehydratase family protein [Candidatus Gottesmanbacteria bacterium]